MQKVRGNDVSMIFQDPLTSLNPTWTVGQQIAEAVRLHRDVTSKQALTQAREVLELVGMPRPAERLASYPHQLSGGLRQRVMIAMALACSPKLLIADEPTTALDVTIQAQILDLLDALRRDLKMAVILITHDLGVIAARANRVMVMYAGKIVEGAGTDELFGAMRHPYTEALFRSIPRLDHDRSQALYSIPGVPPDLSADLLACRFAPRCRYATDRCRTEEPLLAPESSNGRPGAGAEHTDTPAILGANPAGEHVFACFHPVHTSSDEPVASRRGLPADSRDRARAAAASCGVARRARGPAPGRSPGEGVPGHLGRRPAAEGRQREGGLGRLVQRAARRDVRSRRRVGLRQDDDRLADRGAPPCDRRVDPVRGRGRDEAAQVRAAATAPRSAAHVPGSVRVARPAHARRPDRSRAARRPGHRVARGAERARGRAARGGRPPAPCRRALPARVLGRAAAAHRPRPGARPQPEADRRRRARVRARRLDPGSDPQPDARAAARAPADLHRHLPRPRGREVPGRHDRRHVPRQARRDRAGGGDLRARGPSVHARLDRLDRDSRSGAGARAQGRPGARRAPVGDHASVGLPLPHALPAGAGSLRRGGAAAPPVRPEAPCCLPLPPAAAASSAAGGAPRTRRAARRRRS